MTGDLHVLLQQTGSSVAGMWFWDPVMESPWPLSRICVTTLGFLRKHNVKVVFHHTALWTLVCWWMLRKRTCYFCADLVCWGILGEIRETRNLILILLLILYGPQCPQLYIHEKIEFYVISKVLFSTKTLWPLKRSINQEFCIVSTIQYLCHSFLKSPTLNIAIYSDIYVSYVKCNRTHQSEKSRVDLLYRDRYGRTEKSGMLNFLIK